jgi:hypothetical protein
VVLGTAVGASLRAEGGVTVLVASKVVGGDPNGKVSEGFLRAVAEARLRAAAEAAVIGSCVLLGALALAGFKMIGWFGYRRKAD